MQTSPDELLTLLGSDLHIHVLPGIDDGAATLNDSLALIDLHYKAGIRRIVATPHIRSDFFPNTTNTIREAWQAIQPVVESRWPDLHLTYAAEYYADDYLITLLEADDLLPLFDRYLLVETSMRSEQPFFMEILRALVSKGWKPVLAHPERYRPWHRHPERYTELYEMNVIFQVNLLSLGGLYGAAEQDMAERLIQQGWVGALGTDLHQAAQYRYIHRAVQNPNFQLLGSLPLLNHTLLQANKA
ncbi:tyrosine-protein phosphatase [Telluribacter sp.]|jgi:tyrosine-protein phosphatase YwqE|uniref:tyrosine-protein phosphatase n=1 Tax=Telluribacter sp. TaxID=1978767 RepID=UPI002E14D185|nr:CpsB/CapC family capsule biosynthesis tyrosine phosphatase [Telluribacter sp.]